MFSSSDGRPQHCHFTSSVVNKPTERGVDQSRSTNWKRKNGFLLLSRLFGPARNTRTTQHRNKRMNDNLRSEVLVEKLDAAIQERNPQGILVSPELFYYLKDRNRIMDLFTEIKYITLHLLDKKIWITAASLPDGEHFRLPPRNSSEQ